MNESRKRRWGLNALAGPAVGFCLALSSGCGSPAAGPPNGTASCTADSSCPNGYHCASDKTCWTIGQDPDAGGTPVPDMAMRAPTPPNASGISSGGGSPSANRFQLNVSLGGTAGTVTSGGQTLTFGFFNTDSY